MTTDSKTLALHFKYCGLIAAMLMIAIATDRWSTSEKFTTYLSNAATMTSLLLAVVAIFYAFISNDGLSKSLGGITAISGEVQSARQQIGQYLELTKAATDAGASNAGLLRDASQNVTTTLASLQSTLQAISDQNGTLQGLVSALPTRIDQLESRVGDVAKALGEKPPQPAATSATSDISTRAVDHFLSRATLGQNLLAYACILAVQSKKPLAIHEFGKAIGIEAPSNFNGFLNCMHAIELIDRKAIDGKDKIYLLSYVHSEMERQTKSYFTQYIERTFAGKPVDLQKWRSSMANVEALFM